MKTNEELEKEIQELGKVVESVIDVVAGLQKIIDKIIDRL